MDLSLDHKDKDGRFILYQNTAKPKYIKNSRDPVKVKNWLSAFDQIYQMAMEKQVKLWEENGSEYTTITILYNNGGFDRSVYLCPICIKFGKDVCSHADEYFPGIAYKAFLVNGIN